MTKLEALQEQLTTLKAKEARTGGSRKLTWEIEFVRHQIKSLKAA